MVNYKGKEAANVAARTSVAAPKSDPMSDREVAQRFTLAVVQFSAADLAQASHRTKAAAKGWKDASRAPSASSLINLAREIPAVRAWLLSEIGGGDVDFYRPQAAMGLSVVEAQALRKLLSKAGDE